MLLGIKTKKTLLTRHVAVAMLVIGIWFVFWLSRMELVANIRVWRAMGDVGFVLLFLILVIGPLARLWRPAERLLSWRRELGIWFAVSVVLHAIFILDGWVQWSLISLMGYEYLPQFERYGRLEPGFGLANIIGLFALFWTLVLATTSSDKMVNFLGVDSWKWLHRGANTIFYLITAHIGYYLFIHYTISFHRPATDPNWFRWPFLIMALIVFVLQIVAFVWTVRKQKNSSW